MALVDLLVIVDDGSTDATGRIADEYARRHPDKIDVIHQANKGIGGAVIAGIRRLLARDDIDAIGIIASDNQCDPALIPRFRRIIEDDADVDVAKGSRFLHPATLHRMPRFRYWGNRGISAVMQLILGYRGMSDVLHGYLLGAHADVFRAMELGRIADGYDLENTMMAEFRRLRCRFGAVAEPVALRARALEDRVPHADPEDAAPHVEAPAPCAWPRARSPIAWRRSSSSVATCRPRGWRCA